MGLPGKVLPSGTFPANAGYNYRGNWVWVGFEIIPRGYSLAPFSLWGHFEANKNNLAVMEKKNCHMCSNSCLFVVVLWNIPCASHTVWLELLQGTYEQGTTKKNVYPLAQWGKWILEPFAQSQNQVTCSYLPNNKNVYSVTCPHVQVRSIFACPLVIITCPGQAGKWVCNALLWSTEIQWTLVIKNSDITKSRYNKVIFLVPKLNISLYFIVFATRI